ncbi:MAG: hypothetical protein PVG39_29800 [Desulfobacteraceae bacterium]|jgi:hypothetical protein
MKIIYYLFKSLTIFLLFISTAASCAHMGSQPKGTVTTRSGTIIDSNLSEVSGIAVSRINKDILWVINDSGNSASVYALNTEGKVLGTLAIQGVSNNDWEDIASFEYEGKPYILIADVGDNRAKRSKCFLHFIEEPDIKKITGTSSLSIKPSWSITYTYQDGPRDCESVAVDTETGKILLLSKRDIPPVLYELPLTREKNAVAKKITEITPLPQITDEIMDFGVNPGQPTAMDISADGLSAVVLTYGSAFYYKKKPSKRWSDVLTGSPGRIIVPRMRQAESICFGRDGSSIYVTTEQLPAPLYKMGLKK